MHFSLMVIAKHINDLPGLVSPYHYYSKTTPYLFYTINQLVDKQEKEIEWMSNDLQILADRIKELESDSELSKREEEILLEKKQDFSELNDRIKSCKEMTPQQFHLIYDNEEAIFDVYGNSYRTENMDSKFDDYGLGGRFTDIFLTKEESVRLAIQALEYSPAAENLWEEYKKYINPYLKNDNPIPPQGYDWTFIAKIKDIDFDKTEECLGHKFYTCAVIDSNGIWYGGPYESPFSDSAADVDPLFQEKFYESFIATANPEHYAVILDCQY